MLLRISKGLLVAALALTLGFQWTFLQAVAWVGMMVEYSSQGPLSEAVCKTFDGQHPCPICKLVRSGKSTEGKSDAKPSVQKTDLFASTTVNYYFATASAPVIFRSSLPLDRSEAPPLPPPRPGACSSSLAS